MYGVESDDGKDLYYAKLQSDLGLWRLSRASGAEIQVVKESVGWQAWGLGQHGIYYATAHDIVVIRRAALTIHYRDFATGRTTTLFHRESPSMYQSLAVSPDEKWILFSEAPRGQSELMLVENFR